MNTRRERKRIAKKEQQKWGRGEDSLFGMRPCGKLRLSRHGWPMEVKPSLAGLRPQTIIIRIALVTNTRITGDGDAEYGMSMNFEEGWQEV